MRISRDQGIAVACKYDAALRAHGIPVQKVILYGSVARNEAVEDSDLDIAVVCPPFRETRHDENMELRRIRRGIEVRIEPYCIHPSDFSVGFFPLALEVSRTGIEV